MFGRADRVFFEAFEFAGDFVVPVTAALFPSAPVPDAEVVGLGEEVGAMAAGMVVFISPFEAVAAGFAIEFEHLRGAAVEQGRR